MKIAKPRYALCGPYGTCNDCDPFDVKRIGYCLK